MDDLTYSYAPNTNKLMKVADAAAIDQYGFRDDAVNTASDATDDYLYDQNGNMTRDDNKGITSISYNHLNLPVQVNFGGDNIKYDYAADGTKLKKTVSTTGTETLYANGYLYEGNTLQFFRHAEGYVSAENGNFEYVYEFKDHLGNTRLSYTDANGDGDIATNEIVKESNYFPFGLVHRGYNGNVSPLGNSIAKKYMFGGKEYQDELDLGWYDVSARNYNPALGRWMNLDPLAEQMRRHSPYNFAFDNPIYFQDYDGMAPSGCCGNPSPIPTFGFRITMGLINLGRNALGMDPVNVEGSGSDRSSSDGYKYVTEDGQPAGDPSTVTKTDGTVQEVDVTGLEPLLIVAKGKKVGRGDGMTTARDPSKKNPASSFGDGVDRASDAGNSVDAIDGSGTMEAANKSEPDTTFVTTRAGSVETQVVSSNQVSSFGNVEKVKVTVPKSKVDSVNNASQQSLKKQLQDMDTANQKLLDSLKNANNGI